MKLGKKLSSFKIMSHIYFFYIVDWSTGGNHIAVALNNVVSILSCRFKEKVRFLLSFQSVIGDADVSQAIRGTALSLSLYIYSI